MTKNIGKFRAVNPHMDSPTPPQGIFAVHQRQQTSFPGCTSFWKGQDEYPPVIGDKHRK